MTTKARTRRIPNTDLRVGDGIPFLNRTHVVRSFTPFEAPTVALWGCDGRIAHSDDGWGISIPDDGTMEVVR